MFKSHSFKVSPLLVMMELVHFGAGVIPADNVGKHVQGARIKHADDMEAEISMTAVSTPIRGSLLGRHSCPTYSCAMLGILLRPSSTNSGLMRALCQRTP